MRRRQLLTAGLGLGGATVLPARDFDPSVEGVLPSGSSHRRVGPSADDDPSYGDWIPDENHDDPDTGVFFTHADWEQISALGEDENPADEERVVAELFERVPIVGLPLFGGSISLLAPFWMLSFPFSAEVLPDGDGAVDGIETTSVTWTIDTIVFHGAFEPDVFAAEYADDFEIVGERDEFVVYEGTDEFTEGLSYAVSPETLLVGFQREDAADPAHSTEYVGADVVDRALEEYDAETGRMIDEDAGEWLFDSTGGAQMAFGGWQIEDLREALEPEDATAGDTGGPTARIDLDDHPVFAPVESLVNTIRFDVEAETMGAVEARFSGIYPDDAVPDRDDVESHLIGDASAQHEIAIDGNLVHATATFADLDPDQLRSADRH